VEHKKLSDDAADRTKLIIRLDGDQALDKPCRLAVYVDAQSEQAFYSASAERGRL